MSRGAANRRLRTAPGVAAGGRGSRRRESAAADRRVGIAEVQRRRLLTAVAISACEHGAAGVSVSEIVQHAGVSRRTFYEIFQDREECLLAALQQALGKASTSVVPAYRAQEDWCLSIREGLGALLAFLDLEPLLARLLVIESLSAGEQALRLRSEAIGRVIDAVDRGRMLPGPPGGLSRLTAEGVVGAVLSIIHARLQERDTRPPAPGPQLGSPRSADADGAVDVPVSMSSLLGELMGIVVLPYLGRTAAAREASKRSPVTPVAGKPGIAADGLRDLSIRLTYRTTLVLSAIAKHPGASNRKVAQHAGVADQGQISKLLTRLANAGLVENHIAPGNGEPYAWQLTTKGHQLEHTIKDQ